MGRYRIWLPMVAPALVLVPLAGMLVGVAGSLVAGTLGHLIRSEICQRRNRQDELAVLTAVRTLAREVRSGASPAAAIEATAAAHLGAGGDLMKELAAVVVLDRPGSGPGAAGRDRGSVRGARNRPAGRHHPAGGPGREVTDRLATSWLLSTHYGVPWVALIEALIVDLAERVRAGAQRTAQVAGPRVSGYVLAVMPVLGIVLGIGMGANPVHVLFGTGVGHLLLVIGSVLSCGGLLWTARIVRG